MLQKFTLIISTYNKSNKRKMLEDAETPRLKRSETENTATDLFPDVCYFCKIKRKKVKCQIRYCYDVLKDIKGVIYWLRNFRSRIPANVNISGTTL